MMHICHIIRAINFIFNRWSVVKLPLRWHLPEINHFHLTSRAIANMELRDGVIFVSFRRQMWFSSCLPRPVNVVDN